MTRLLGDFAHFVVGLIELLLMFRFILKLLAANPAAEFVGWIYATTEPLLQPFRFAFPAPALEGGFVLEITSLFALLAYAFFGYLLQELIVLISSHRKKK